MVTKVMGLLLFIVGLLLIVLAIIALLGLIQPSGLGERLLMFLGGLILVIIGYYMARDEPSPPVA
jgi:Na+/H+ antiporter NhaD/arsenite permease-like protein